MSVLCVSNSSALPTQAPMHTHDLSQACSQAHCCSGFFFFFKYDDLIRVEQF